MNSHWFIWIVNLDKKGYGISDKSVFCEYIIWDDNWITIYWRSVNLTRTCQYGFHYLSIFNKSYVFELISSKIHWSHCRKVNHNTFKSIIFSCKYVLIYRHKTVNFRIAFIRNWLIIYQIFSCICKIKGILLDHKIYCSWGINKDKISWIIRI